MPSADHGANQPIGSRPPRRWQAPAMRLGPIRKEQGISGRHLFPLKTGNSLHSARCTIVYLPRALDAPCLIRVPSLKLRTVQMLKRILRILQGTAYNGVSGSTTN